MPLLQRKVPQNQRPFPPIFFITRPVVLDWYEQELSPQVLDVYEDSVFMYVVLLSWR